MTVPEGPELSTFRNAQTVRLVRETQEEDITDRLAPGSQHKYQNVKQSNSCGILNPSFKATVNDGNNG